MRAIIVYGCALACVVAGCSPNVQGRASTSPAPPGAVEMSRDGKIKSTAAATEKDAETARPRALVRARMSGY
jgi:hypothetical protein